MRLTEFIVSIQSMKQTLTVNTRIGGGEVGREVQVGKGYYDDGHAEGEVDIEL